MKKIVKLTERDLTRIVRRVIKEQEDNNDDDFINHLSRNRNQLNVVKSDPKETKLFLIQDADSRTGTRLLKNFLKQHKDVVRFISIIDCDDVDLSGIDFCECPDLVLVNLQGTPNNFEETQNDCYKSIGNNMYDITNS